MIGLANIYVCPTDGEIADTMPYEHIDTDNDEIYPVRLCTKCGAEVKELTVEVDGKQMPVLTEVEDHWMDYMDDYDAEDEWY